MQFPWFKRFGIFFFPSTFAGWIIAVAGCTYAVYDFIQIDQMSHSVSDTLIDFVPELLIFGVLYSMIALFTSRTMRA